MGQSGQAHAEGDRMVDAHADKDPAPPQEASSLSTHLPTHPFLMFHADTKVRSVSFFVVEICFFCCLMFFFVVVVFFMDFENFKYL